MGNERNPAVRSRYFALGIVALLALANAAPFVTADTPPPPRFTALVPDLSIEAATFEDRALDLTDHFAYVDAGEGSTWTFRVLASAEGGASGPELYIDGAWLGIAAPDSNWTGSKTLRVEACTVRGAESGCVASNPFAVTVTPPGPGSGPPPGSVPTIVEVSEDGAQVFTVAFPEGVVPRSPPRWLLDGQPAGTGHTYTATTAEPGEHRLVVLYDTAAGSGVVFRIFTVATLPPAAGADPTLLIAAGLFVLLGVLVPARTRSALVVGLFSSVTSRTRKDSLLDHFNRGALHQVIKENPGIHFSALRRRVGISHGTAIWHLRMLEQGGIVRATRVGAFTTFTVTGAPLEPQTYGLSPSDRAVLALVRASPGISLPDLARNSDRSLGTISRAVTRLVALGFVTTQLSRRRRLVFPRPDAPRDDAELPPGVHVD